MSDRDIPTGYIFLPGLLILAFVPFVILLAYLSHWGVLP
jgi:hypothetical protein